MLPPPPLPPRVRAPPAISSHIGQVFFVGVVGVVLFFQLLVWGWVKFLVIGRGHNPKLLTVLSWRFQGSLIRVCYFGFYAVSSTAMFQMYLHSVANDDKRTMQLANARAGKSKGAGSGIGAAPIAATATSKLAGPVSITPITIAAGVSLLLLSLVLFGATTWVMRSPKSTEERVTVTVGSFLLKNFKRENRFFWMFRPVQILVMSFAVGILVEQPPVQIGIVASVHVVSLILVIIVRPFATKLYLVVTIIVEAVRVLCALLMLATMNTSDPAVEVLMLVLNSFTLVLLGGLEAYLFFKRVCGKRCGGEGSKGEKCVDKDSFEMRNPSHSRKSKAREVSERDKNDACSVDFAGSVDYREYSKCTPKVGISPWEEAPKDPNAWQDMWAAEDTAYAPQASVDIDEYGGPVKPAKEVVVAEVVKPRPVSKPRAADAMDVRYVGGHRIVMSHQRGTSDGIGLGDGGGAGEAEAMDEIETLLSLRLDVHHNDVGTPYYHDVATGTVTWALPSLPAGMDWGEDEDMDFQKFISPRRAATQQLSTLELDHSRMQSMHFDSYDTPH